MGLRYLSAFLDPCGKCHFYKFGGLIILHLEAAPVVSYANRVLLGKGRDAFPQSVVVA